MIPVIGEAAAAAGAEIVKPIGNLFQRLVGLIPDKDARAKAAEEMERALASTAAAVDAAQSDINKVESQSASLFVAGWRPFIGWVCGSALAYQFVLRPLLPVVASALGHPIGVDLPGLDDNLWQLLTGMLGLGGLRTYEKKMGVARS